MDVARIEADLEPQTLAELRAVPITPGRPLIAVDVDEVLVVFVDHLDRHIRKRGFEMRLVTYQLEGTMFPIGGDTPLPFSDCIDLINGFFHAETERQQPVAGGREALERLSEWAQVVILTNVPRHATKARRVNLDRLGLTYPMVVNSGGKGRALAWLAARAAAPAAMIDDSVRQIESAAKHLPGATRLHFAEAEFIRRIFPGCAHATEQVHDWPGAVAALERHMPASGGAE